MTGTGGGGSAEENKPRNEGTERELLRVACAELLPGWYLLYPPKVECIPGRAVYRRPAGGDNRLGLCRVKYGSYSL